MAFGSVVFSGRIRGRGAPNGGNSGNGVGKTEKMQKGVDKRPLFW